MRKPRTKRTNTKANWRAELQAMNERLPKQLALRDKILAQTEAFLARKRELEALAFEQICLSERLSPFFAGSPAPRASCRTQRTDRGGVHRR